jgi:hypothetical protein
MIKLEKKTKKFEQENDALRNKTDMLEREMAYLKGMMNQSIKQKFLLQ